MLPRNLSVFRSVRPGVLRIVATLGLVGLAAVSSAHAVTVSVEPATVVPADTYSLRMIGYNLSYPQDNIALLGVPLTPTFGLTQSYPGYARGNQTVTVTSVEFPNGNSFADFISVSVPTNFVPAGTVDTEGHFLNAFQFFIGITPYGGSTDPLDYNTALASYTVTSSITFVQNGQTTSGAVPTNTTLTNGNKSLSSMGYVYTSDGSDISNNQVTAFSFNISYTNVPEPSTNATIALGVAGMLLVVVRRRRRVRL